MKSLSLALSPTRSAGSDRAVGIWLAACAAMVLVMVVIGGITRLTLSGLSIVEWNPVMGAIPPLNEADWEAQFALYKATPQYLVVNHGMTLAEFRTIFWWEFIHRLWGRLLGFVFLLPFLYFALRRRIDRRLAPRLSLIFVLGGLQGALGWFMVKSGLVDRPSVIQYRLAAHLAVALIIYAAILWLALDLLFPRRGRARPPTLPSAERHAFGRACGLAAWILFVALSGAFVAGLHAGLVFNSFPLMEGQLIPDGLFSMTPWIANPFEDVMTVQFDHRMLAMTTVLLVILFRLSLRRLALPSRARLAANLLALMVVLQLSLGVSTLLLNVPVPLAASHQAGAILLFTLALWIAHELRDRTA